MTRPAGWQENLWAEIDSARVRPFEWGSHDCCQFAAKCVDAISGANYSATLLAQYNNQETAAEYLAQFVDLQQAVESFLGTMQAPNWAGPGDVVLANLQLGQSLGVCLGANCAFATAPAGLLFLPVKIITGCWRIA